MTIQERWNRPSKSLTDLAPRNAPTKTQIDYLRRLSPRRQALHSGRRGDRPRPVRPIPCPTRWWGSSAN